MVDGNIEPAPAASQLLPTDETEDEALNPNWEPSTPL